MQRELSILGVVAVLAVAFYGGRRSFNATAEYAHADIVAVAETCDIGMFVGGCKECSTCQDFEYPAGGCSYFKDTFCTLCEVIHNCPQDQIRCTSKDDQRCLVCDPGFWDDDCKPCLVCEAGSFEEEKCTQTSNTVCRECNECPLEQYTATACTYFSDTVCAACTNCPSGTFTDVNCQTVEESSLLFPESVYTVRPDTVCTTCTEPIFDGVNGPQSDEFVTAPCNILKDTTITDCFLCPCEDRETCQYMTDYCTSGDIFNNGDDTICEDCTKRRGPREWEVFKCGGTSDALFKPCSICMEGEYELQACTETSDTICPKCSLNVLYGQLDQCTKDNLRCTAGPSMDTDEGGTAAWSAGNDNSDTVCLECEDKWFGETCCYHQYFGSCGTLTTRERIAARYGFEGETNEEFVDFCLELCDEFPDCLAFEIEDGGADYMSSGPNNLISKTATCYFKASFSQEDDDLSDDLVFKGDDPRFDCYSNVCRQNKAFAGSYVHTVKPPAEVAYYAPDKEYETGPTYR